MAWFRVRRLGACLLTAAALIAPARVMAAGTPVATGTATPAAACTGTQSCTALLLSLVNRHRARHHLAALQLLSAQSRGAAGCPGSYGHSTAMAESGGIWHTNERFPRQSFPHNICVRYEFSGENVGEAFSGNESSDIESLDHMMMQEPHSSRVCASIVNHACNILDPDFRSIGIGLYVHNGATWLTEDFIG
jgi:uncharacterized protein YkwD